jgi:hypothetical protein
MTLKDVVEKHYSSRIVVIGIGAMLTESAGASLLPDAAAAGNANSKTKKPRPRLLTADLLGVIGCHYLPERDQLLIVEVGGRLSAINQISGLSPSYTILGTGYKQIEDVVVTADRRTAYITERVGALLEVSLDAPDRNKAKVISTDLEAPQQLQLDEANQHIYLVEFADPGHLWRFDLRTGERTALIDKLEFAIGVLLSADRRYIYVSEEPNNSERRIRKFDVVTGEWTTVATSNEGPLFYLYWLDADENAILVTERDPSHKLWLVDMTTTPATSHCIARVPHRPSSVAQVPGGFVVCCDSVIVELSPEE